MLQPKFSRAFSRLSSEGLFRTEARGVHGFSSQVTHEPQGASFAGEFQIGENIKILKPESVSVVYYGKLRFPLTYKALVVFSML
ncbi:hypothetical protein BUALT_Bualt01G0167900 [Buddleja alternifolia]|uniref:Uncharacterized protein n=1 Tax=Buddleja alternifolia TaxID=168488 RepID=A0AAV6Y8T3_9LAMI|nr:hypothetical protein BUALT_Bualt01G0167900 [Buddleja alternifolia]